MTSLDKIERAPLAEAPENHLTAELTDTIRLSAPMALTQLGQIAMMTTDLAFIGRLGSGKVRAGVAESLQEIKLPRQDREIIYRPAENDVAHVQRCRRDVAL